MSEPEGDPIETPIEDKRAYDVKQVRTILVVEEDEAARDTVQEMLERLDFEIRTAGSGEGTLRFLDDHGADIDLVLSDIVLPDMSGMELFRLIQERGDRAEVILMSGYSPGLETLEALDLQDVVWLEKPFTAEDFKRALERLREGG